MTPPRTFLGPGPHWFRSADLWLLWQRSTVDPAAVARATALALAEPTNPEQTLRELLRRGEMLAAETLLFEPAFRTMLPGPVLTDLETEALPRARLSHADELAARRSALTARAERVGVKLSLPPVSKLATKLKSEAEQALEEAHAEVAATEDKHRHELEARMADSALPRQVAEQVKRHLDRGAFEVARWLLDGSRPLEAASDVPLYPAWPFFDQPRRVVLGWFRREGAPPRDFPDYRPAPGDTAAEAMLAALEGLEDVQSHAWTTDIIDAFGRAFAGLFDVRVESTEKVFGGFTMRVQGLHCDAQPALGPAALPDGLDLWIAHEPGTHAPATARTCIAFHPVAAARPVAHGAAGADDASFCMRLDANTIFALLGDGVNRRERLLLALGRDIPLTRALPREWGSNVRRSLAACLAKTDSPVVVVGRPGAGKTTLARAIELSGEVQITDDAHLLTPAAIDAFSGRAAVLLGHPVLRHRIKGTGLSGARVEVLQPLAPARLRELARSWLAFVGVTIETDTLLDRVAYQSGGYPGGLTRVLRAALAQLARVGAGPRHLREEHLDVAFTRVRGEAVAELQKAIEPVPWLGVLLSAVAWAADEQQRGWMEPVSRTAVVQIFEYLAEATATSEWFDVMLGMATELGILMGETRAVRLPPHVSPRVFTLAFQEHENWLERARREGPPGFESGLGVGG